VTTPIEAKQAGPDELRLHLPIPFVLAEYDHHPASESSGRLHYLSPFRADTNASFDVFKNTKGEQRWGDFAESLQGSVIDLVIRFEGGDAACTLTEGLTRCTELYVKFCGMEWEGPSISSAAREPFNPDEAQAKLDAADSPSIARGLSAFLYDEKTAHPSFAHLDPVKMQARWGISTTPDGVLLIPYLDSHGDLVAVRHRGRSGKWFSTGSNMALYGLPNLSGDSTLPVLLCEGESDAWVADAILGDRFEVLAVPGTGHLPERLIGVEKLEGREVYIAFDGDSAGRTAAVKWAMHVGVQGTAYVIPLPPGKDIAGLTRPQVLSLPGRSRPMQDRPLDLIVLSGNYARPATHEKGNPRVLNNWHLALESILRSEDGSIGFQGKLQPHNTDVIIPIEAMASTNALVRWCNMHAVVWSGGAGDHQRLLQLLLHESVFLPEGRMTRQAGWHEGDFVWPGGHIGTDVWEYVPPASKINLEGRISLPSLPCNPIQEFMAMYNMHRPDITGPFLAWLATAPIRPLFSQYPILSISGGSGTGKTTLTETLLAGFSGSDITTNLTSTTPYAVTAFFASANAIPVWFDEYRPGAREDAKNQLDQLLRDSYTGQPSYKGGMTDNKAEVTEIPTVVPVLVTGEESFIETSHTDRMVLLRMTKEGRGPIAKPSGGYARTYLEWLLTGGKDNDPFIERINVQPAGDASLNDRQRINLGVLDLGWRLLSDFFTEINPGFVMPKLDTSNITKEATEAQKSNPILEAVRWALENNLYTDPVWKDEQYVYVAPVNLRTEVAKSQAFVLPTNNAKGIKAFLVDNHQAIETRVEHLGKRTRVMRLPLSEVEVD